MNFNPRAPYGARHNDQVTKVINRLFQSTRPIRGATSKGISIAFDFNRFQSTRPIRGATWGHRIDISIIWDFNPRAPYGARQSVLYGIIEISNFNPRAPYGARLILYRVLCLRHPISIHAPHTGRDLTRLVLDTNRQNFNPRAPYGARLTQTGNSTGYPTNFNPRAPYGARPRAKQKQKTREQFQSTRPIRGATAKMHNLCSAFLQ